MNFSLLFSSFVIIIVLLSIYKIKYGIAAYWVYLCLIPFNKIFFAGFHLSYNLFSLLILFIFVIKSLYNKKAFDITPIKPFLIYFFILLLIIPFQTDTPLSFQISIWGQQFCKVVVVPFIVWNIFKYDNYALRLFKNVTIVCIIIVTLYGFFLTKTGGMNPYIVLIESIGGDKFDLNYYISDTRIFGRISSVFLHPMTFALFLGLSLIFIYYYKDTIPKTITMVLLVAVLVMSFFCGVRSVLGALAIVCVYYLISIRNLKFLISAIIIFLIIDFVLHNNNELYHYVLSIGDINNNKGYVEGGSSIGMRLSQLNGCFNEIKNDPILGKGYGWVYYYEELHGDHPVILGFESLIFVVLCNEGLLGVGVWIIFGVLIFQTIKKLSSNKMDEISLKSLFVFYIIYSIVTGEYGYMEYFSMFYILCLMKSYKLKER
jgi:hypothetical protein